MRLHEVAPVCHGRNHSHELKRCDRNCALSDGHRNRFTRIPFMMVNALHPFLGRNQTRFFAWQVDPGSPTEAQACGVLMNPFDPHALPDGIKEYVTGIHDRLVKIGYAVSGRPPAMKDAPVKIGVSRTKRGGARTERLGLKPGG